MIRFRKAASVIVLVLITACTAQPVVTTTQPPTLLPTREIPPTLTATPFVTPTASATPVDTATPTVTATPWGGLAVDLLSPDGTVRLQSYDWKKYEIVDAGGNVIWSFMKDKERVNVGVTSFWINMGIRPLYWSPDGKKLFLAASQSEDNSSTKYWGNQFADADEIYRFDLETGEMIALVPEQIHGYYAAAVSPDASLMVYANQTETPVRMKLLDLATMEAKTLFVAEEKILEIGSFGWSPDMSKLIFSTMEVESEENTEIGHGRFFDIFLMDLSSLEVEQVIDDTEISMRFNQWIEPNQVRYRDTDRSYWLLNLETHELSKIEQPAP